MEINKRLVTPIDLSDATPAGKGRWRKEVLPFGATIQRAGKPFTFTKELLTKLVESFPRRVPLVIAGKLNLHPKTADKSMHRGQVVGVELSDRGLDAIIELDDEGERTLKTNPKLGVSARIVMDAAKPFIEHVALTSHPRIPGMAGWQKAVAKVDDKIQAVRREYGLETVDLTGGNDVSMLEAAKQWRQQAEKDQQAKSELYQRFEKDLEALDRRHYLVAHASAAGEETNDSYMQVAQDRRLLREYWESEVAPVVEMDNPFERVEDQEYQGDNEAPSDVQGDVA